MVRASSRVCFYPSSWHLSNYILLYVLCFILDTFSSSSKEKKHQNRLQQQSFRALSSDKGRTDREPGIPFFYYHDVCAFITTADNRYLLKPMGSRWKSPSWMVSGLGHSFDPLHTEALLLQDEGLQQQAILQPFVEDSKMLRTFCCWGQQHGSGSCQGSIQPVIRCTGVDWHKLIK